MGKCVWRENHRAREKVYTASRSQSPSAPTVSGHGSIRVRSPYRALGPRRCPLWVNRRITQLEHNRSAYALITDMGADMSYRPCQVRTARWCLRFVSLFCGDRQVPFVAIELEGLKLACCYRTVGLATGGDRSNVRGARRCGICF